MTHRKSVELLYLEHRGITDHTFITKFGCDEASECWQRIGHLNGQPLRGIYH